MREPHVGTLIQRYDRQHVHLFTNLPPHLSSGVFTLFVFVSVLCACPDDKCIRFHFLSQHHVFTSFSLQFDHVLRCDQSSMSFSDRCEQISCTLNVEIEWTNLKKIFCGSLFSNLRFSQAVAIEQTKVLLQERYPPPSAYAIVSYWSFTWEQ